MKAQFHDQFTALSDFAVSYWPFLLATSLIILSLLLALVSVMRSRRELRTWLLDARLQQAEQGTGLQQLLSESNEIASTRANLLQQGLERRLGELNALLLREQGELRSSLAEKLSNEKLNQQEALTRGLDQISTQVNQALLAHGEVLGRQVNRLLETTDKRLSEISGQVDARLDKGFEKTTETFNRVLQHLSRIDEAQKKLAELSANIISLQEILSDKRSRGAYGEIQLAALVRNLLPENAFSLQQTLPNGTRVDCLLELPEPTGRLAVDAKFPLESFRSMTDPEQSRPVRERSARQFRQDVKKHIGDIATKYIIDGETASGAMMFIPAEAVFAEIHAHHPGLVEEAQRRNVWLVSPTTLMAILTTTRSVLRDAATQQQVHLIRQHLHALSKDFQRFRERMDKLSRHISLAHQDVSDVHRSASRISDRFQRIDDVDIDYLQQNS
ncbi:MAG: DNA recombination protein RmuC [Gammaproteobacteria bacterium]